MEIVSTYISIIVASSTFALFLLALFQLRHLRKAHSIEVALSLEKEIRKTEKYLVHLATKLDEKPHSEALEKELRTKFTHSEKVFYDLIDKLCFCILEKYIAGEPLKGEYDPIIKDVFEKLEAREKLKDHKNINTYAKSFQ